MRRTAARATAAPSGTLFPGTLLPAVASVYVMLAAGGPLARGMTVDVE